MGTDIDRIGDLYNYNYNYNYRENRVGVGTDLWDYNLYVLLNLTVGEESPVSSGAARGPFIRTHRMDGI